MIAESVHPHYRAVARTYAEGPELEVVEPPAERGRTFDGRLAPDVARRCVDGQTAALIVQQPNFLGAIEDLRALAAVAHDAGALFVVAANPIALALLEAPGAAGADIVVGEGQPLGIPLSFGGPWLGLFAAREQYIRQMPGRIVGVTTDVDGRRGFVLTLQAREQHIRRERATSNICTNQGLMALRATIHLGLLGRQGLREVAELCVQKTHHAARLASGLPGYRLAHAGAFFREFCLRRAHHAAERIGRLAGYALASTAPFFHEFVVRCPRPVDELVRRLEDDGILAGYRLGRSYPDLTDALLFCVTEMNTPDDIERLVAALEKARG